MSQTYLKKFMELKLLKAILFSLPIIAVNAFAADSTLNTRASTGTKRFQVPQPYKSPTFPIIISGIYSWDPGKHIELGTETGRMHRHILKERCPSLQAQNFAGLFNSSKVRGALDKFVNNSEVKAAMRKLGDGAMIELTDVIISDGQTYPYARVVFSEKSREPITLNVFSAAADFDQNSYCYMITPENMVKFLEQTALDLVVNKTKVIQPRSDEADSVKNRNSLSGGQK